MIRVCSGCHWMIGMEGPYLKLGRTFGLCRRCYRRIVSQPPPYAMGT